MPCGQVGGWVGGLRRVGILVACHHSTPKTQTTLNLAFQVFSVSGGTAAQLEKNLNISKRPLRCHLSKKLQSNMVQNGAKFILTLKWQITPGDKNCPY